MPTEMPAFSRDSTLRVEALGDRALLAILGKGIDPGVNDEVHRLASLIRERELPGVHDLVPAYATVAVHYDPAAWSGDKVPPHEALKNEILRLWEGAGTSSFPPARQVDIPVCYGGAFGPDLAEVAGLCALSEEEVIARHAAAAYRVYMIGFSPGFAYLGGLDPTIATPRRATPRLKVPAGSVGIAGMQTGIYPVTTPGGWQIIGRTPKPLFLPTQENPCLLYPGDRLRFVPIDEAAFQACGGKRP
jgi:KipI family sensor histidine kinase inhibitor